MGSAAESGDGRDGRDAQRLSLKGGDGVQGKGERGWKLWRWRVWVFVPTGLLKYERTLLITISLNLSRLFPATPATIPGPHQNPASPVINSANEAEMQKYFSPAVAKGARIPGGVSLGI